MVTPEEAGRKRHEVTSLVGEGIAVFVLVETMLGTLYAHLMRPAPKAACEATLKGARHLETKLRIIRKVSKATLQPDRQAQLAVVLEHVRDRGNFRHKLAHWPCLPFLKGSNEITTDHRLVEGIGEIFKTTGNVPSITKSQIEEFHTKCLSLIAEMASFISDDLERPPERL
jgi:hypothetical protein